MKSDGAKSALLVFLGVALGFFLSNFDVDAGAQSPVPSSYSDDAGAFRNALTENAAPQVAFGSDGTAKFSRPLEVPSLYAFDSPLEGDGRQIILVDAETKHICVYWIRPRGANSTIELVATRTYEVDVKLENFNGEGLSPAQIREQATATP